jgi:hypothetical protein
MIGQTIRLMLYGNNYVMKPIKMGRLSMKMQTQRIGRIGKVWWKYSLRRQRKRYTLSNALIVVRN